MGRCSSGTAGSLGHGLWGQRLPTHVERGHLLAHHRATRQSVLPRAGAPSLLPDSSASASKQGSAAWRHCRSRAHLRRHGFHPVWRWQGWPWRHLGSAYTELPDPRRGLTHVHVQEKRSIPAGSPSHLQQENQGGGRVRQQASGSEKALAPQRAGQPTCPVCISLPVVSGKLWRRKLRGHETSGHDQQAHLGQHRPSNEDLCCSLAPPLRQSRSLLMLDSPRTRRDLEASGAPPRSPWCPVCARLGHASTKMGSGGGAPPHEDTRPLGHGSQIGARPPPSQPQPQLTDHQSLPAPLTILRRRAAQADCKPAAAFGSSSVQRTSNRPTRWTRPGHDEHMPPSLLNEPGGKPAQVRAKLRGSSTRFQTGRDGQRALQLQKVWTQSVARQNARERPKGGQGAEAGHARAQPKHVFLMEDEPRGLCVGNDESCPVQPPGPPQGLFHERQPPGLQRSKFRVEGASQSRDKKL